MAEQRRVESRGVDIECLVRVAHLPHLEDPTTVNARILEFPA